MEHQYNTLIKYQHINTITINHVHILFCIQMYILKYNTIGNAFKTNTITT